MLHTWTRELLLPHVHCVVTAGGLTLDGKKWLDCKRLLFAVGHIKAVFRARMLAGLDRLRRGGQLHLDDDPQADVDAWKHLFFKLHKAGKWVAYTEAPIGRSTHVLQYLGRYTHRIGLSDQRLVAVSEQTVTFRTRGDATVTLPALELMRRYLRHVLPTGLNKIRHVGLYAAVHVIIEGALAVARQLLGGGDQVQPTPEPQPAVHPEQPETWAELLGRPSSEDQRVCPQCRQGRLLVEAVLQCARAPPETKR